MRIYYAAPLHNKADQERNLTYAQDLRDRGHAVYLPQEHGLWEQLLAQFGGNERDCRRFIYENDIAAMQNADMCVAMCCDATGVRAPSEGMLWEMGYMKACNKPVLLCNPQNLWAYNLMPEFGSKMFTSWHALLQWLEEEC